MFATSLAGGLISELLEDRFTTGGADIKTTSCDATAAPVSGDCMIETEIGYISNETPGPYSSALTPTADGLRFVGRFDNIRFNVRVSGRERISTTSFLPYSAGSWVSIASDGTIDIESCASTSTSASSPTAAASSPPRSRTSTASRSAR